MQSLALFKTSTHANGFPSI